MIDLKAPMELTQAVFTISCGQQSCPATETCCERRRLASRSASWIEFQFIRLQRTGTLSCITAGQVSDYTGAAALLSGLPDAEWLLADRGYGADWFREALFDRGTRPCIPDRKLRNKVGRYDKRRYKRRNRIERMFGRLKDWRRVATR